MNHALTALIILYTAALLPACSVFKDKSPPKSRQEMEEESRSGQVVPDNLRDPRPDMPPMGPLSMPMR